MRDEGACLVLPTQAAKLTAEERRQAWGGTARLARGKRNEWKAHNRGRREEQGQWAMGDGRRGDAIRRTTEPGMETLAARLAQVRTVQVGKLPMGGADGVKCH